MTIADKIRRAKTDYDDVHNAGFDEGREWGFEEGRDFGYDEGYGGGYDEGYTDGYDEGYTDGVSGSTVTFQKDESTAYVKTVPNNAEPKAMLMSVGGMTRKCNNLFDINTAEAASPYGGFSSEVIGNTLKVTCSVASRTGYIKLGTFKAGDYSIRVIFTNLTQVNIFEGAELNSLVNSKIAVASNGPIKFTLSETKTLWMTAVFGNSVESYTFSDIMINEGTTALPYEPYFEGLRDSKVTEIIKRGKNLFNPAKWVNAIGEVEVNGVRCLNVRENDSSYYEVVGDNSTAYMLTVKMYRNSGFDNKTNLKALAPDGTIRNVSPNYAPNETRFGIVYGKEKIYFSGWAKNDICIDLSITQIEFGTTATEYEPYHETIKTIPEEITALEGYGKGIDSVDYNYIDFNAKQYEEICEEKVLTGGENIGTYPYNGMKGVLFYSFLDTKLSHAKGICTDSNKVGKYFSSNSIWIGVDNTSLYWIGILDILGLSTVDEFKTYLADRYENGNPVRIVLERAQPIITDLSTALADFDNILDVEHGGSLEFVNEYGQAVPSSILYTKKVGT